MHRKAPISLQVVRCRVLYMGNSRQRFLRFSFFARKRVEGIPSSSQQKCGAVPRRDRIYGPQIVASINSRLESYKEEKKKKIPAARMSFRRGRTACQSPIRPQIAISMPNVARSGSICHTGVIKRPNQDLERPNEGLERPNNEQ